MKVPVVTEILKANDQVALENRSMFEAAGVRVLNVMASPGAGKTSLILATVERLRPRLRSGVMEGDMASSIDAETIAARQIPVVQINTGGNCHLDAPMVRSALPHLPLAELDVLFIENVGNLICPSNYRLGADLAWWWPACPRARTSRTSTRAFSRTRTSCCSTRPTWWRSSTSTRTPSSAACAW